MYILQLNEYLNGKIILAIIKNSGNPKTNPSKFGIIQKTDFLADSFRRDQNRMTE